MMRHPPFERLRSFAAGEVEAGRGLLASHLQDCIECRQTITVVRDVMSVARESFAPPAPEGALERILARRAAGESLILPASETTPAPSGGMASLLRRGVPWAAALLLGAAGMAAALPGSPVRNWIERLLRRPAPTTESRPGSAADSAVAVRARRVAGITIPLASGELWVAVEPDTAPVRIRFRLTDGAELEVRGIGAAAGAVFRPRSGGVGITNSGGGELQVDVPRAASRFTLRVRGVPFVIKEGARLRVLAPNADTIGAELLFIARP